MELRVEVLVWLPVVLLLSVVGLAMVGLAVVGLEVALLLREPAPVAHLRLAELALPELTLHLHILHDVGGWGQHGGHHGHLAREHARVHHLGAKLEGLAQRGLVVDADEHGLTL